MVLKKDGHCSDVLSERKLSDLFGGGRSSVLQGRLSGTLLNPDYRLDLSTRVVSLVLYRNTVNLVASPVFRWGRLCQSLRCAVLCSIPSMVRTSELRLHIPSRSGELKSPKR